MKPAYKLLIKTLIVVLLLFSIACFVESAYSAFILGNQLAHANIASTGVTLMGYLVPIVLFLAGIIATITWKKK